ncbi:polysaccharide biosynthesis tyrosine autokinase [Glaciibacter superstes]|uniref:polysaccharide biosynthesis tyrosine autokinase n=1 Tax=Glaciibacter superstes TaxID=501023 RepID=UPI0003B39CB5|nr:polysaccharide biosynthesis tyrosine autokinase [Glaciibacter superstes]
MEPRMYLTALRRRWVLILLLGLVGAAAAMVYDSTQPTLYKSTASVFVSTQRGDTTSELVQGSTFTQANVLSYAQLARTPVVLQPVVDELDLAGSAYSLAKAISVDVPLNTVIIDITAENGDAGRAAEIANAVSKSLSSVVEDLSPKDQAGKSAVTMTPVAPAVTPSAPYAPNTRLIVVSGIMAGLAVGLLLTLLWELLDPRLRTVSEVLQTSNAPLLGAVARLRRGDTGIAMLQDAHSQQAESYRRIRTNLEFANVEHKVRHILLTSATIGEGKTTTTINLALALAERSDRVLLIDADLRNPQIADRCSLERSVGLTTVLVGKIRADEAVQRYGESLDVLTSGVPPHNPGQLLGSQAMAELLGELAHQYDFIVIDTPPLLGATDALGLVHAVDGVVVVVRYRATRRPQLLNAIEALRAVNADILGTVFNGIKPETSDDRVSYRPHPGEPAANVKAQPGSARGDRATPKAQPELAGMTDADEGSSASHSAD